MLLVRGGRQVGFGGRDDVVRRPREVQVTICPGGPLLVRGADVVRDDDGVAHQVTRPVVAICRCEKSSMAPWCDGTHKLVQDRRRSAPPPGKGEGALRAI